jgi:hypothetical protein
MTSECHDLVHFNLGMAKHPLDHPGMAGFVGQIDSVNRLAATSPGFVWMAADGEAGDAAAVFGSALALANISTWRSVEELFRFVYGGLHGDALSQRRAWFEPVRGPAYALWWVPQGYRPNWVEAKERLQTLATHGPTRDAFTFRAAFAPDGLPLATELSAGGQPDQP